MLRTYHLGYILTRRQISLPALTVFVHHLFGSIRLRLEIAIILFFRCMSILLDPVNRARGDIKRLLVTHTVAIFMFLTVFTAINSG